MPDTAPAAQAAADVVPPADVELVERTRAGDADAFAELWRRHHRSGLTAARSITSSLDADDLVQEAYTRIYQSILKGGGPTGSFRAYLFTSIRHTAASWGRSRVEAPIDELDTLADPASTPQAAEEALDRGLTHRAFRSLPTRWQEVLWYSEIEQLKPAQIAPLLGMKPAAVAQLAFRAREGLREAWIQAHLSTVADGSPCQWTIERLGAYARGNLGRRDRDKVDAHLRECARCTIVAAEARDVGGRLALVLLPIVLGVTGGAAYLASLQGGGAPIVAMAAGAAGPVGTPAAAPASAPASAGSGATAGGLGGATAIGLGAAGVLVAAAIAAVAVFLPRTGHTPSDPPAVTAVDRTDAGAPASVAPSAPPQQASPSPGELPDAPPPGSGSDTAPAPVVPAPPGGSGAPAHPAAPAAPAPQPAPAEPAVPAEPAEPAAPVEPAAPALPDGAPAIASSRYVVVDPTDAEITLFLTVRGAPGATVQALLGDEVRDSAVLGSDGTAVLTLHVDIDDLGVNPPVGVRYVAGDAVGPVSAAPLRDVLTASAH